MPIYGLTEGREHRWPIIGRIRKGDKRENGAPYDLNELLRFSGEPAAEAAWASTFGSVRVKEVHGRLAGPADEAFTAWRDHYAKSGLQMRCDGRQRQLWRDSQGAMHREPAPCLAPKCWRDKNGDHECAAHGQLRLIVPEMVSMGFAGVVVVETGSITDLVHLSDQVRSYEAMFGGVEGLPVKLDRREGRVNFDGQTRIKWFLRLEAEREAVQALAAGERLPAITAGPAFDPPEESALILPPPAPEPDASAAIDADELEDGLLDIRDPAAVPAFVDRLWTLAGDIDGERLAELERLAWQHVVTLVSPYVAKVSTPATLARFRALIAPVPTGTPGLAALQSKLDARASAIEPASVPAGGG